MNDVLGERAGLLFASVWFFKVTVQNERLAPVLMADCFSCSHPADIPGWQFCDVHNTAALLCVPCSLTLGFSSWDSCPTPNIPQPHLDTALMLSPLALPEPEGFSSAS